VWVAGYLRHPSPGTLRLHSLGCSARGDHRHETSQGVHCCGGRTWQPLMSRQTAGARHDSPASCCPHRQSSCSKAGLIFRPTGLFTIEAGAAENPPRNCFSSTPREGFCMPRAGSSFAASTGGTRSTSGNCLQGWTFDLVRSSSEASAGGEPFGGCLCPWFVARSITETVLCTPALFYTVYSPCI
jgi:hypothetical protein